MTRRRTRDYRRMDADPFVDEGVSGSLASGPELDEVSGVARPHDTIVVQAADRLAHSVRNLLLLVGTQKELGIALRIPNRGVDSATPTRPMVLTVIAAFAEMTRAELRKRTLNALPPPGA